MNGIDGVLVATGQDYRAIEANVHLFASKDGSYKPLTQYWIEKTGKSFSLCGSISIPLSVGVKGGVIQSNPTYKYTLGLLSNPSSARLKCILASVGLAQNFAALRALVSEGITRGHLALHSQSIAISAGVPLSIIPECVAWMKACGRTGSKDCAKEFLLSRNI
jgi:hydroxymethylglutaryl-CoA reductase